MPTHYVYDEPDRTSLSQGDVLQPTEPLVAHLRQFHPHYAGHHDYKFFMVVTQSCDLARRPGQQAPSSPYITLAAVRPLEEVLRREAAQHQQDWQREAKVISAKTKDKLMMFVQRILDNNESTYFYLHEDVAAGIHRSCCAFLQLKITLKSIHYELCLAAKVAQLTEPFQAKLGYLLGHMYNRVGTVEWNTRYPDNKVATQAAKVLDESFFTLPDQQIAEGVAALRANGTYDSKSPSEVKDFIVQNKVKSRKEKFQELATVLLKEKIGPIDLIRSRVEPAIRTELANDVDAALEAAGITGEPKAAAKQRIIDAFVSRFRTTLSDANMPKKEDVLLRIVRSLVQDAAITKILS